MIFFFILNNLLNHTTKIVQEREFRSTSAVLLSRPALVQH